MSWATRFRIRQYLRESLWVVPFLGPVIELLLGEKGKMLLPKVRDWMNANSRIVSEARHRPVRRDHREQPVSG